MTLNSAWFVLLAFMLAGYAVLDGFDLGIGAIHLLLGRTRDERERLVREGASLDETHAFRLAFDEPT
jgi:cytochrome d ubiquinol oxidase subunit II